MKEPAAAVQKFGPKSLNFAFVTRPGWAYWLPTCSGVQFRCSFGSSSKILLYFNFKAHLCMLSRFLFIYKYIFNIYIVFLLC